MAVTQNGITLKDGTEMSRVEFDQIHAAVSDLFRNFMEHGRQIARRAQESQGGSFEFETTRGRYAAADAFYELYCYCKDGTPLGQRHLEALHSTGLLDDDYTPLSSVVEIIQYYQFMNALTKTPEGRDAVIALIDFCRDDGTHDVIDLGKKFQEAGIQKETGIFSQVKENCVRGNRLTDVFVEVARAREPSPVVGAAYAGKGVPQEKGGQKQTPGSGS